jgi:uncharacterized DUF497 family protein
MEFDFEWDPAKGLLNTKNHGVTFEEAASVLLDPLALSVFDQAHSIDEERWFTIGQYSSGILMVVVHTFETLTATRVRVRVISARKPTTNERRTYEAEPR